MKGLSPLLGSNPSKGRDCVLLIHNCVFRVKPSACGKVNAQQNKVTDRLKFHVMRSWKESVALAISRAQCRSTDHVCELCSALSLMRLLKIQCLGRPGAHTSNEESLWA